MALLLCAAAHLGLAQTLAQVPSSTATETPAQGAISIPRQVQPQAGTAPVQPLPRHFAPTLPRESYATHPWKTDITATVFWIGEPKGTDASARNSSSAWDVHWMKNFGGADDPDPAKRTADFRPAEFVPKLNPFYVALPYNDVEGGAATKAEATRIIPWFKQTYQEQGKSVCRDRWIVIRLGERVCYAQWSDCGPFVTDDASYVFGSARPSNTQSNGAGLSLSPAVRDYLGFTSGAKCDWRFADLHEVPDGPWRRHGTNNPFTNTEGNDKGVVPARLEELRKQREDWFQRNGKAKTP